MDMALMGNHVDDSISLHQERGCLHSLHFEYRTIFVRATGFFLTITVGYN